MSTITIFESHPADRDLSTKTTDFLNLVENDDVKLYLTLMASHRTTVFMLSRKKLTQIFGEKANNIEWCRTFRTKLKKFGDIPRKETPKQVSLFILSYNTLRSFGIDDKRNQKCLLSAKEKLKLKKIKPRGEAVTLADLKRELEKDYKERLEAQKEEFQSRIRLESKIFQERLVEVTDELETEKQNNRNLHARIKEVIFERDSFQQQVNRLQEEVQRLYDKLSNSNDDCKRAS